MSLFRFTCDTNDIVKREEVSGSEGVPNSSEVIKTEVEENDDIIVKDEFQYYDASDIIKKEEILESERSSVPNFGHSNEVVKTEVQENDNIKDKLEYYDSNDIDSKCNTEIEQSRVSRGMIKTEVEENKEEEEKFEINIKSLDYELERPTIKNANKKPEIQFKCYECNYQSKRKHTLKRHIFTIHQREKVCRYACELCPYETVLKTSLNTHIRHVHEKEKEIFYACELCPYDTIYKDTLNRHIMAIHEREKAPRYGCKSCPYETIYKGDLNKHIKYVHKIKKRFECDKCDYKSNRHSDFNRHRTMHEKEDASLYTCEFETVLKQGLHGLVHEVIEKKFECEKCKYKTRDESSFNKHLTIHEKKHHQQTSFETIQKSYPIVPVRKTYRMVPKE